MFTKCLYAHVILSHGAWVTDTASFWLALHHLVYYGMLEQDRGKVLRGPVAITGPVDQQRQQYLGACQSFKAWTLPQVRICILMSSPGAH